MNELKKITDYLLKGFDYFVQKICEIKVVNSYMINVICLFFMLIFSVFMIAWFEQWIVTGKADLSILLQAIDRLVMPSTLAVVKFVTEGYKETKIKQSEIQCANKSILNKES